jgi:PEGA domain
VIAPSQLHVESDPSGANVSFGGRAAGVTPLTVSDLGPAIGVALSISKAGFTSYEGKIDLIAGETTDVRQTLRVTQRFGTINISVQDAHGGVSAGNVYLAGKLVGEAPIQGLRLPVGQHVLVIKNAALNLSKSINVVVDEKTTRLYPVRYD